MKNSIFLLIFSISISFTGIAQQTTLSQQESKALRNNIIEKSKKTTSIISDFKQYKHLDFLSNDIISSGKLVYKSPNSIKWEYQKPFKYSATFKKNKLYINDNGVKNNVDLSSNKAFKSLNELIIRSVKGDMFDDVQFKIVYFKDYTVSFSPKDKKLKSFINEFILTFDKNTLNVIEVKMIESSKDYTLIRFTNQQLNKPVSDAVFSN
ncbi:MAG: outer membrane lipoprotein carrier protein LolA [Flavobacteriaceae bacterium]|nr:outer membrane lipoprotein carrier protein LolA [Flavobacteriaceae bacterium]